MKLIIEDDEGRKTVVPIVREDVEITIGRQEGNTIRLTERNVSRRHAKLVRRDGAVLVEDLGSYNGIRVNGDKIDSVYEVNEGDLIQIGDYDLAVQYEDSPRAVARPAPAAREKSAPEEPLDSQDEPNAPQGAPRAKKHESTAVINATQMPTRSRNVVDVPVEQAPRLVVITSEFTGREFACIRSEIKIGRTEDNDIAIDHRSLSRNHCKVVREEDGEWKVIDLQSSNGVKVNGEQYGQCALHSGDVIELGHISLKFLAPGEAADPPAPGPGKSKKGGKLIPLVAGAALLLAGVGGGGYFLTKGKPASMEQPDKPASGEPKPVASKNPGEQQPGQQAPADQDPATPGADSAASANALEPKPDTPEVDEAPVPPAPKALKAYQTGKTLFGQSRFELAEKKLAEAVEGGVTEALDLLEAARDEVEAQDKLAEAQQSFGDQDYEGAKAALDAIPPVSSFAPKAEKLRERIATAEARLEKQRLAAEAEEARRAKAEQQKQQAAASASAAQGETAPVKTQAEADLAKGKHLAGETLKRYKEAITFLERALKADSSLAEAHLYLGLCYASLGQVELGAKHYEEFVHLAPGHPRAQEVVDVLKEYFKASKVRPRWPLPE